MGGRIQTGPIRSCRLAGPQLRPTTQNPKYPKLPQITSESPHKQEVSVVQGLSFLVSVLQRDRSNVMEAVEAGLMLEARPGLQIDSLRSIDRCLLGDVKRDPLNLSALPGSARPNP